MKSDEKTAGFIVLAVGAFFLYYLYSNGQLGAAANSVTSSTPAQTGNVTNNYSYNIPPLPAANTNFNVSTTDLNVVSYVPLFGFIGTGQFWQ